jgi:3-oxoacyl-[acyl-carrier protein] reductase
MDLHLKNKTVIITGGSRGLGRSICFAFAGEGANVALTYNGNKDSADQIAAEISEKYSVQAKCYKCDVSSESDVQSLFAQVVADFGSVEILVNNAAICPIRMIRDTTLAEWQSVINTNLTGVFLACREMVNYLIGQNKGGRIVNVGSQAAYNGSRRGKTPYSASKGGVLSFTSSLAKEVAADNIYVNGIAPGLMRTEMTAGILSSELERYNQQIPLGRIAETDEVANFILYLASDQCSYTTGATIDISGGMIGI